MATFGLAPYFRNDLLTTLSTVPFYSVSFDESLNRIFQKGQMDLLARFWDEKDGMASTRYLKSELMDRSSAVDVLGTFSNGTVKYCRCHLMDQMLIYYSRKTWKNKEMKRS